MSVTRFSPAEQPVAQACEAAILSRLNSLKPAGKFTVHLEQDLRGNVYIEMKSTAQTDSRIRDQVRRDLRVYSFSVPGKPAVCIDNDISFPAPGLEKLGRTLIELGHDIDLSPLGISRKAEPAMRT